MIDPQTAQLSWTNLPSGFSFEEADALSPTNSWQPYIQSPTLRSNQFSVTVNLAQSANKFFRLRQTSTGGLPPDPGTVASPLDATVVTDFTTAIAFLYSSGNPIQTGVTNGAIDSRRTAVLRGQVLTGASAALSGVRITVLGHPEFGQTLSRLDGAFDLAVNGGGQLTVRYEKDGFLALQRAIVTPWRDYAWLPDVVMIPFDTAVTTIDLSAAAMQVARGSAVSDADGARQATLLFPQGTSASLIMPNGSTQTVSSLNIRATEYTVGTNGPAAMPAKLPPSSGYTYCVELSADEAIAQGATSIQFNRPLLVYVENFLGFPVGGAVPTGYYDRQKGQWIASANGRVIKVLSITGGLANLDTDGDAVADDATKLAALGISNEERVHLAQLYTPGQTLWRVPITHLTPWDCNWPFGPPLDAISPPGQNQNNPPQDDPNEECGSVIGCENQSLGESVPITGTPWRLHYRSQRTPGRKDSYTLNIPVSGAAIPASLQRMRVEVGVAGRLYHAAFSPAPNLTYTVAWDGRDSYGRTLQGGQPAVVKVSYDFVPQYYAVRSDIGDSFARAEATGAAVSANREQSAITLSKTWTERMGGWDARALGLGGWSLSVQHAYDPVSSTLLLGDGGQRRGETMANVVIITVAGTGAPGFSGDGGQASAAQLYNPYGVAVGSDGSLFIADFFNHRIRRVGPNGIITTVAGTGVSGFSGDGGPATAAQLGGPSGVAVGPDGSLYITDFTDRIRRVGPDGIITTFAGTGTGLPSFSGDGGSATAARISYPSGAALGPDGSLYFADQGNNRIRRVGPNGIISTVAGTGALGFSGDGGAAVAAQLYTPTGVAVGPDGSLYIADLGNNRIRRVGPNGIITTVVGDFGLSGPTGVALGSDGSLYIADRIDERILRLAPDGIVTTVAGNGNSNFSGDGGPATAASLYHPYAVAVGPDGSLYIAQLNNDRIRRVGPTLPDFSASDFLQSSEDGRELYVFNSTGRHLKTLDALTGAVRYQFSYDAGGYLISAADGSGNATTIERSGAVPSAIVAPGGQRTALIVSADGWLLGATNPAAEAHTMSYSADGLMQRFIDPLGSIHNFTYDALGRLIKDENPACACGSKTLSRTEQSNGYTVTTTSTLGRSHVYQVEQLSTGAIRRSVTEPSGAKTVTVIGTDGKERTMNSDGSYLTIQYGPDPRWGMLARVATSVTLQTSGGLTRTVTTTRTATLADPRNLLSLTNLTDTVTDNGLTSTRVYDSATHNFTVTSAEGRVSSATLDALGRPVSYQRGGGVAALEYSYDAAGRLASVTQGIESLNYIYDSTNRVVAMRDASGHSTAYEYDAADRATKVTLPSGLAYALTYDANGNTTRITMPNGAAHILSYSANSEEQAYTPPVGPGALTWGYDLDGAWTGTTLPGGRMLVADYDGGARPTGRTYAEAAIEFQYSDTTDQMSSMTRTPTNGAAQTVNMSFDSEFLSAMSWVGAAEGQFSYSYDNRLFLTGLSLSSGSDTANIALTRDKDGLLTAIGPFTLTHGGPAGAPSQIADAALSLAIGYDSQGRVATRHYSVNGALIYGAQLSYDSGGSIVQRLETVGGIMHTNSYAYDADSQLTQVTRDGATVESYSYDVNRNRISALAAASYDAQDRLTSLGGVAYQFDVDGFLASRASDAFQYSTRGELISATVAGQTVTYSYDGFGRRVGRTLGTDSYQYLYGNPVNPFQLTAVRSPSNALTVFYYDENGLLLALERGGARYYVATDQVGTPRVVSDATGAVVKVLQYDSFGKLQSDSDPSFDVPIGFSGGLADTTTGFVYFGLRDYDPGAGRWTARDPLLFEGRQMNLYVYVGNNPISGTDLAGLFTIGATAYDGIGGGFRLTFDSTGFKICGELGVGFGGGLEGELNSSVGNTDFEAIGIAEISAKAGYLKVGIGGELRRGGCVKLSGKAELGPLSAKVDLKNGKLTVGAKGKLEGIPSVSLGGKIAERFCGGAKF